jgi:catechol 2,3-dioxygenase-like lactoylglutathione lyase family enzyme
VMAATATERMYPILPCRDLDEAIGFYEALGFERTHRQVRPNPSAVVARGDLQVHLAGIEGFDPAASYGSVIIVVPDPDALAKGVDVAARLADSHGDDAGGLATLERALTKHPDAPAIERARALAYRADLAIRLDRLELARASLDEIGTLVVDEDERASLVDEMEHLEALFR